jgi:hypothetical protein
MEKEFSGGIVTANVTVCGNNALYIGNSSVKHLLKEKESSEGIVTANVVVRGNNALYIR